MPDSLEFYLSLIASIGFLEAIRLTGMKLATAATIRLTASSSTVLRYIYVIRVFIMLE